MTIAGNMETCYHGFTTNMKERKKAMMKYSENGNDLYIVVTAYEKADAYIALETEDLEEAKRVARIISATDRKDAHTFITRQNEYFDGNYDEIEFD